MSESKEDRPSLQGFSFNSLEVGQTAEFSRQLTAELIDMFAAVSGDLNPVHLDQDYAETTAFGERIGHGIWVASLISAALAMRLPGPGAIYRSQQIRFKEAVRLGDTVTVQLEVASKKERSHLVEIACKATNQHGKTVALGSAEVIAPTDAVTIEQPAMPDFRRVN